MHQNFLLIYLKTKLFPMHRNNVRLKGADRKSGIILGETRENEKKTHLKHPAKE